MTPSEVPVFLSGGGEVGALTRTHDWTSSTLGHPTTWPQSLQSVVGLMLNSMFPMFVVWGPELGFLYNDAYAPILGDKHPWALGRRFEDIWGEVWSDIHPIIVDTLEGEASFYKNLPLTINRTGVDETAWFTFSYSPLRDESGAVATALPAPGSDESLARVEDGADADVPADWMVDRSPSPGASNVAADGPDVQPEPTARGCGNNGAPDSDAPNGCGSDRELSSERGCVTSPMPLGGFEVLLTALVAVRRRRRRS